MKEMVLDQLLYWRGNAIKDITGSVVKIEI